MTTILAIDTATDACSVCLYVDGEFTERSKVMPRQHSKLLFPMLRELLPHGNLRAQGVDALAYGCGPGSFTGLRIAASAVQGLAFANDLPAIPISTLACQAQAALRLGVVTQSDTVLSLLDARINEVYAALIEFEGGLAIQREGPVVTAPDKLLFSHKYTRLQGVGSGFCYAKTLPTAITGALVGIAEEILPAARDLIPLALELYRRGEVQEAEQVAPVYVREEISWKKLAEQGKPG